MLLDYSAPRVLVVVPAFNEQATVGRVVSDIRAAQPAADVLVIDDGSTDRTAAVAGEAGAAVCSLPFNLGVGGAMRAGYRFALRRGYDVVVQVDADGQHDPAFISLLVDALDDADVVIGARFAGAGVYTARGPRRWAMSLLARSLSWLSGEKLCDVTSGFRAANSKAMTIFAAHYPAEYLGDTVESLVIALRTGCRVRQVPVAMRPRQGGHASQSAARSTLFLLRAVVALGLALVRQWPLPEPPRGLEAA
ncbi:MAG: glycosyltransferase family 2 protein [Nocardioidaceae bacterium]